MFPKFVSFEKALYFLEEMADNNNRDWFNDNKQRYEDSVRTPALSFIETMKQPIGKISECLIVVPKKVGGSMMRPYRDTRFSKDKTPLKTNLGIQFRHRMGKDAHAPGFYVHVEPGKSFIAAGTWRPESSVLKLVRADIAEGFDNWNSVLTKIQKNSPWEIQGDSLKKNPKGFSSDHPGIELLKLKDHVLVLPLSDQEIMDSKFLSFSVRKFKQVVPYMGLLCQSMNVPF